MKFSLPLTVMAMCSVVLVNLPASADMTAGDRQRIMDRELNCVSNNVHQGVTWNDVCYTSEGLDKDRVVTKSMDQMINEQGEASHEMLKDENDQPRTMDSVSDSLMDYSNSAKTVDDTIHEQGVGTGENTTNTTSNDSSLNQHPQYTQYAQNFKDSSGRRVDFSPEGDMTPAPRSLTDVMAKHNVTEVGFEYNRQRYVEPVFDLVDKGSLFGGYVSYTARPEDNNELFRDVVDMFKAEVRGNYGHMNYSSSGSGKLDDVPDFAFEVRGVAGKDFNMCPDSRLTPFLGLGFRYLNDDSSGKLTSTGAAGYERESHYFYAPIGAEVTMRLAEGWFIAPNVEYDLFINGTQNSHLSNVNSGFPDVKNKQHKGFGVRGSVKLIKQMDPVNFVFEPYVRFWHIQDSDTTTAAGPAVLVTGLEPENKTTEYGVRLGVQF
jgi:hypothetical protein